MLKHKAAELKAGYDKELPKPQHWPEDRYAVFDTDGYRLADDLSKEMALQFAAAPNLREALGSMIKAYGRLHDGLSDMIESGRLQEAYIPDDYQWMVKTLSGLCIKANMQAENAMSKADGKEKPGSI